VNQGEPVVTIVLDKSARSRNNIDLPERIELLRDGRAYAAYANGDEVIFDSLKMLVSVHQIYYLP